MYKKILDNAILYICVPNSISFHKLWAYESGLINNLDDLIKQIVQENNSIYKRYQLNEIDVVYETNGIYYICEKGR